MPTLTTNVSGAPLCLPLSLGGITVGAGVTVTLAGASVVVAALFAAAGIATQGHWTLIDVPSTTPGPVSFFANGLGGATFNRRLVTVSTNLSGSDFLLSVDSTTGPIVLTLPSPEVALTSAAYVVHDEVGYANPITVVAASGLVEGEVGQRVPPHGTAIFYCTGAAWCRI